MHPALAPPLPPAPPTSTPLLFVPNTFLLGLTSCLRSLPTRPLPLRRPFSLIVLLHLMPSWTVRVPAALAPRRDSLRTRFRTSMPVPAPLDPNLSVLCGCSPPCLPPAPRAVPLWTFPHLTTQPPVAALSPICRPEPHYPYDPGHFPLSLRPHPFPTLAWLSSASYHLFAPLSSVVLHRRRVLALVLLSLLTLFLPPLQSRPPLPAALPTFLPLLPRSLPLSTAISTTSQGPLPRSRRVAPTPLTPPHSDGRPTALHVESGQELSLWKPSVIPPLAKSSLHVCPALVSIGKPSSLGEAALYLSTSGRLPCSYSRRPCSTLIFVPTHFYGFILAPIWRYKSPFESTEPNRTFRLRNIRQWHRSLSRPLGLCLGFPHFLVSRGVWVMSFGRSISCACQARTFSRPPGEEQATQTTQTNQSNRLTSRSPWRGTVSPRRSHRWCMGGTRHFGLSVNLAFRRLSGIPGLSSGVGTPLPSRVFFFQIFPYPFSCSFGAFLACLFPQPPGC